MPTDNKTRNTERGAREAPRPAWNKYADILELINRYFVFGIEVVQVQPAGYQEKLLFLANMHIFISRLANKSNGLGYLFTNLL